jgi:hypothetical protein
MTRSFRLVPLLAMAVAVAAASAQTDVRRAPSLVRVHVTDSLGAPVEGAEISLVRGLKTVVATARSSAAGDHEFLVDLDSSALSAVVRKIGYSRGDRFFNVERAAVDARVTIKRLSDLPAVTVTAVNLRQKSYHLDADDIANSPTYVGDGIDIIRFIKPDMATSRSGSWSGRPSGGCAGMQNIWINGRWYPGGYVLVDPVVQTRMRTMGRGVSRIGAGNLTILSELAPEHIAEMNFSDCFEPNKLKRPGATNALFVTLKPGVDFRLGYGSFVVGDTAVVASRK